MHSAIVELANALQAFTPDQLDRPTQADRTSLMSVRNRIKRLGDGDGVTLNKEDARDRQYLYVESTRAANRQEDFYERNQNEWATT